MSRDTGRIDRTMRLAALALVAGVGVFATVGLTAPPDDVPAPAAPADRSATVAASNQFAASSRLIPQWRCSLAAMSR